MYVVGAKFGGLVETEQSGIDMVIRTGVDMMGTPMVSLAIDHEGTLVRARKAIEGEEGDPSKREGMAVVIVVGTQAEGGTSVDPLPSEVLQ